MADDTSSDGDEPHIAVDGDNISMSEEDNNYPQKLSLVADEQNSHQQKNTIIIKETEIDDDNDSSSQEPEEEEEYDDDHKTNQNDNNNKDNNEHYTVSHAFPDDEEEQKNNQINQPQTKKTNSTQKITVINNSNIDNDNKNDINDNDEDDKEEEEQFDFDGWIEGNKLSQIKHLFQRHQAITPSTLSPQSEEFKNLFADTELFKTPHLIPIILESISEFEEKESQNDTDLDFDEDEKFFIVAKDEHDVMQKIDKNITDLDKIRKTVTFLKEEHPKSTKKVKDEKYRQVKVTETKINQIIAGIIKKLNDKQKLLKDELKQIQNAADQQQKEDNDKAGIKLKKCTKVIEQQKEYLDVELSSAQNTIKKLRDKFRGRQRREKIAAIGQQVDIYCDEKEKTMTDETQQLQKMVDQHNNCKIEIDFRVNDKNLEKIKSNIWNCGIIINNIYGPNDKIQQQRPSPPIYRSNSRSDNEENNENNNDLIKQKDVELNQKDILINQKIQELHQKDAEIERLQRIIQKLQNTSSIPIPIANGNITLNDNDNQQHQPEIEIYSDEDDDNDDDNNVRLPHQRISPSNIQKKDIKWNTNEAGKYLTFSNLKTVKMTKKHERFAICLANEMITNKMCNKFEIQFKISNISSSSTHKVPALNVFIGYVEHKEGIKKYDEGLGLSENKLTSTGIRINSSYNQMRLYDKKYNSQPLEYKSEKNFKNKDKFGFIYDFETDVLQIMHNDVNADRILLDGVKSIIPAICTDTKGNKVEIVKCEFW